MSLTKTVVPIQDSRSVDTRMFDDVPVFHGFIPEEEQTPAVPKCFLGAFYRKVFSSLDSWLGIEGVIRLGEFQGDPNRFNLDGKGRFMDNPGIYMGGKSFKESDAGLGLNLTYLSSDTSEVLGMDAPKLAYRPFWRYIYAEAIDIENNVRRREVNSWNVSNPKSLCYYYFPGDLIRMKIYSPIKDYLQLRIEVLETTTIPKYVELRQKYHLPHDRPSDFYSPLFHSEGHGRAKAEFKRVNSIDQFGNEGFVVKATNATVSEAVWLETYLYRMMDDKLVKVPFNKTRQVAMACPDVAAFTIQEVNPEIGGEAISIHPGKCQK